jgi:hypothetical protein
MNNRTINIGRLAVPYKLVRSATARKLKLSMTMDEFHVTAPTDATDEDIKGALARKRRWIVENTATLKERYEKTHKIARFRTGAKLPYWGRLSALKTQVADVDAPTVCYHKCFHVEHPNYSSSVQHDEAIEAALHTFLRQRFSTEAQTFARIYSEQLRVKCHSLRITQMARRWGSCTNAGNISLDWRLVYAPKRVAAYVIAHELTHLKVSNHSCRFWNLLCSVYGEYDREHFWLRKNEHLLGYSKVRLCDV